MLSRREVLAASMVLPTSTAARPAKHPKQRVSLVGAWSLIDAMTVQRDGSTGDWNGLPKPYSGLIIYEANGTMAVQIASRRSALAGRRFHEAAA